MNYESLWESSIPRLYRSYEFPQSHFAAWHFWVVRDRMALFRKPQSEGVSLASRADGNLAAACVGCLGVLVSGDTMGTSGL